MLTDCQLIAALTADLLEHGFGGGADVGALGLELVKKFGIGRSSHDGSP